MPQWRDFLERFRPAWTLTIPPSGGDADGLASRLPGHDHRCVGGVHHRGADRAEQHPGESTAAVASHHQQLGRLGFLK